MYFEVETWEEVQAIKENYSINNIEFDKNRNVYCIEVF